MANRKVKFDFNPFKEVPGSARKLDAAAKRRTLKTIEEFVEEQILLHVGDGRSPVKGERFKSLSSTYAEAEKGGNRTPNLELEGDMLDSLSVKRIGGNVIRATVSNSQQPKADGHNNFTGKSTLPKRRFIPDEKASQHFKQTIRNGIKSIIREALDDGEV